MKTKTIKAEMVGVVTGPSDKREHMDLLPIGQIHNNLTGGQVKIAAGVTNHLPTLVLFTKNDRAIVIDLRPLIEAAARELMLDG